MDQSVSVRLLSRVAEEVAVASGHGAIEPEHLLVAAMKVSVIPDSDLLRFGAAEEVKAQIMEEIGAVRRVLEHHSIDPESGIRRLLTELGRGGIPFRGGPLRHSERTRDAFLEVEKRTRKQTFGANELLETLLGQPSLAISRALGLKAGRGGYLKSHCWDWTQMAEDGELHPPGSKSRLGAEGEETRGDGLPRWLSPETVALIRALAGDSRGCIFLVSEDCFAAGEPVSELAFAMIEGTIPAPLKRKRLLILPCEKTAGSDAAAERDLLARLAIEAARTGDIILYFEGLDSPSSERERHRCETLNAAVLNSGACCICGVSPQAFRAHIEGDASWKACFGAIWLQRQDDFEDIPWEL